MYDRIFVEDLDEACIALDAAEVEYEIDDGGRLFSENTKEITDILEENEIDYDLI